jgi:hypothetical protein
MEVREKVLLEKSPARALAYEDVILEVSELDDDERAQLRKDRATHFRQLLEAELQKLGPLTPETAKKHLAQLLAFRRESRRVPGERLADLAPIDKGFITERLLKAAEIMWREVETLAAREHFFAALQKGAPIVAELPAEHPYRAKLTAIRRQAADKHSAIAAQATDAQFGAKLLHTRIAGFFGAASGDVARAQIELAKLSQLIFAVETSGSCADFGQRLKEDLAPQYGRPAKVSISITGCSESPREWETRERGYYTVSEQATEQVSIGKTTKTVCSGVVDGTRRESSTVGDTTTTYNVSTGSQNTGCRMVEDEQFIERDITVQKELYEDYTKHYASHEIDASGTFQVELDGRVATGSFKVTGKAEDVWWTAVHVPSKEKGTNVRGAARGQAYEILKMVIQSKGKELLAEPAARFTQEGDAASSEGRTLDAEHAWFVASAMGAPYKGTFEDQMRSRYALDSQGYSVAVRGGELPSESIRGDAQVSLPAVPSDELAEERRFQERHGLQYDDLRSILNASITFGPMQWRRDEAKGGALTGGLASLSFAYVPPQPPVFAYGGQMRLNMGVDATGTGMIDFDALAVGGFQVKGFHLEPVAGLGFNFTSNTNEGPVGNEHHLPAALYLEYGGRFSYAFEAPVTVELVYTKAYRADATIQSERRADARLTFTPFSLSLRYTEQMAESDFIFASFGSGQPVARLVWVLAGFGM